MKDKAKILIVDDDQVLRDACENILLNAGYDVKTAQNPDQGIQHVKKAIFDIVITDYRMPSMNGIEFMRLIQATSPQTDIIMVTGYATIEMAVEAMRMGAFNYLQKPFKSEKLLETVQAAINKREILGKSSENEFRFQFDGQPNRIIGKSQSMQQIFRLIEKVGPTDSTILIQGESGTGKELIAKAIHAYSLRKENPFFAMDCGSLVESLFESEIFGHVKGSFTGASMTKHGAFELADTGSFFLDEIGNISLNVQAKILRAIQEKEIRRVGGTETIKVDVRVISATNLDLEQAVQEGSFREDLYYRLSVIPIVLPPLRERKEDIPLLIDYLLKRNNLKKTRGFIKAIENRAMQALLDYDWPGNIRELQNTIERAAVIESSDIVALNSLPHNITDTKSNDENETFLPIRELEKDHITKTLEYTKWNISKTAKILGIDRKTLYDKIKKYQIKNIYSS